jgi:hypothetical protein
LRRLEYQLPLAGHADQYPAAVILASFDYIVRKVVRLVTNLELQLFWNRFIHSGPKFRVCHLILMHTFGQTNVRMRREHLKRKAPGRIVFLKRLRLACSIRLICNHMENKPEDLMRRVGAQTTIGEIHRRKRPSMTSFFTNHRCWLYHHGLHAGEICSASSLYATLHRGASQLSIRNIVCDAKVKSW